MRERVRRIHAHIRSPVDVIAIVNATSPHVDHSFFYASGIDDGVFEGCGAFLYRNGNVRLVVSPLEAQTGRRARLPTWVMGSAADRQKLFRKALARSRRIGYNAAGITQRSFAALRKAAPKGARFVDVSDAIIRARLVKDRTELSRIRKACTIASDAFDRTVPRVRAGMREYEVAAELVHAMQQEGATGPSFRTIVGSGPNGAEPHYTAGNRKLRRGDLVVIDFGAAYRMYVSDVTRTVAVGRATREQKRIHETVLRAQEAAFDRMREGVRGSEVDAAARDLIDASKYRGRFIHGLGHSIGLAVHDGGGLGPSTDTVLERNMVFTDEPGIYIPGFGGVRIEDDIQITAGRPKRLTPATRELLEV